MGCWLGGVEGKLLAAQACLAGRMDEGRRLRTATLDESHYAVVVKGAPGAVKLTLPLSDAASVGRTYVIRNVDASSVSLQAQPGSSDTVEDKTTLAVKKKAAVTLVADGEGGWWLAATAQ